MAFQGVKASMRSLTKAYPWTLHPLIVSAPMKNITTAKLAVAVAEAGGIGFIGPGNAPEDLEQHLQEAKAILSKSESLRSRESQVLPLGIAVQTWTGDLSKTRLILSKSLESESQPAAIWLFAPRHGQAELDDWSRSIREIAPGIQIWIQVASVKDAAMAYESSHCPDVIVVQGHDAGGHSLTKGAGIVSLLPEVSDLLHSINPGRSPIPLIAAGGIADARGAAAMFVLGASGVAMGTRFLAAREAAINVGYQQAVIESEDGGQSTVRTQLYNHLRGTFGWPEGYDARGLVNASWRDSEAGLDFEENQKRHEVAVTKGAKGWGKEHGRVATYAGTAVGLVRDVQSAKQIVEITRSRIVSTLQSSSALWSLES